MSTPESNPTPKRGKSKRPSSLNTLLFVGSFLLCIALFVGISIVYLPSWLGDTNIPFLNTTSSTTTTTQLPPPSFFTKEDRFSMAVYVTDDENQLQTAVLAVFQPDLAHIGLMGVPAQTALPDSPNDSLARRFQTGGAPSAQLGLLSAFGNPIDYYVVLRYSDVAAYLTALDETLTVNLSKEIQWTSDDGSASLKLTSGKHALAPTQVANLLRYDNWQGGRRERADQHATIVKAYLEQFLTSSRSLAADRNTLQTVAETNLSSERFADIATWLTYLAEQNTGNLCALTPVDGKFEGAGNALRFELSNDVSASMAELFS